MTEMIVIEAQKREELGKEKVKKLRKKGFIPAILYGGHEEPQPIKIEHKKFIKILHEMHGEISQILKLKIDNKETYAVIKDIDYHPVSGDIIHIDFQRIVETEEIEIEVPVITTGSAKGVQKGGLLEIIKHTLTIRGLPFKLPKHIEIDVSDLDIGDSIHVKDIKLPEGIKAVDEPTDTVLTILAPRKVEEEAPTTEEAQPEVKTEEEKTEEEKKES